ncbi:uncharacterized protein LOC143183466 [Calliopsis andreniformis]|uniref:uncharacterized protein LOC143183466 n=1 Tax=Calliopsis andreniformis TaxID=337506 RepID=UPI003FCC6FED
MSIISTPELLTEAAGVKIFRTPLLEEVYSEIDSSSIGKICIMLQNVKEAKLNGKSCGFHLSKSKWDLYPWVSHVETESLADAAGLRAGDCLLSINGKDLIGLKIRQIAIFIHHSQESNIKLFVWRYTNEEKEEQKEIGIAIEGPLPDIASKLANAVSGVVQALECPVCLESSMSPVSQCVHGHIICVNCRPRTSRCPVCRIRLGQGRCLLADKLHKIFREIFNIKDNSHDNIQYQGWSLRDRLFGKNKKNRATSQIVRNSGVLPKARQLLLNKLSFNGLEKAASVDNISKVSNITSSTNETVISSLDLNERLSLYDRTKSASTGELSKDMNNVIISNRLQPNTSNRRISSTTSLLPNVPSTSIWGDSVDSVFCIQITCPLSKQSGCKDIMTYDAILAHLRGSHDIPQIHFYSIHVKIPFPLPFGSEAVYILHHGEDLFFFQCEQETAWITCVTGAKNSWEWSLHGCGENGTEIKIRRKVASFEDSITLSPQHLAPLPNALLLHTLDIQLLESHSHEQLEM